MEQIRWIRIDRCVNGWRLTVQRGQTGHPDHCFEFVAYDRAELIALIDAELVKNDKDAR